MTPQDLPDWVRDKVDWAADRQLVLDGKAWQRAWRIIGLVVRTQVAAGMYSLFLVQACFSLSQPLPQPVEGPTTMTSTQMEQLVFCWGLTAMVLLPFAAATDGVYLPNTSKRHTFEALPTGFHWWKEVVYGRWIEQASAFDRAAQRLGRVVVSAVIWVWILSGCYKFHRIEAGVGPQLGLIAFALAFTFSLEIRSAWERLMDERVAKSHRDWQRSQPYPSSFPSWFNPKRTLRIRGKTVLDRAQEEVRLTGHREQFLVSLYDGPRLHSTLTVVASRPEIAEKLVEEHLKLKPPLGLCEIQDDADGIVERDRFKPGLTIMDICPNGPADESMTIGVQD